MLVVLWCSCAFGEVTLYHAHRSIASLTDGHSDYSDARFLNFYVAATDFDGSATQADLNLTGTMTLSGGNYSFWNGRNGGMLTNSGTQRTFGLAAGNWMSNIGDSIVYSPMTTSGDEIMFCLGADGGLNGVNVSWNLSSYSGQGTIPNYRTTQQQLASCVPYIEFIRSGTQVTGIRWRAVNPSDTSKPAPQNYDMSFCVQEIRNKSNNTIYYSDNWPYIPANTTPEGVITFDSPIEESEIHTAWVFLNNNSDNSNWATYLWYFRKPSTPEPYIIENFMTNASIVNGKADYSNARFESLFFDIRAENVMAEARHFTADASVTIPGGGYSLMDDNTGEELGVTIPAGTDKTFKLRMHRALKPGNSGVEYQPIYDNGANLTFSGGGENLAGRAITWTFPAELNLSGSGNIQDFKSTAEQLATGAPYFEIVSRDGNITAINYRLVTSSNTSTAVTPSYRTDFRIEYYRINPDPAEGRRYRSSWINRSASGTWTLGKPQPLSNMDYMTVRCRTWEDPNNSRIYVWNFYPAEAPSTPAITTTSLPAATLNTSYTATLTSNISGARWSVISGSLPAGLTLNASTGDITGTPTAAGTSTFTVKAESGSVSAEKSLSITVNRNSGGSTGIRIENSSSGGCESGLAISSALLLLALFVKKR